MQGWDVWGAQLPIWVSRETADGMISQFSVPLWLFMLIGVLGLVNVLLWGGIGVYEAFQVMLG